MKLTHKITIILSMLANVQLVKAQNANNFIQTNSNAGLIWAAILVLLLLLVLFLKSYLKFKQKVVENSNLKNLKTTGELFSNL